MHARVAGLALAVTTVGTLALSGCGQAAQRSGEPTVVASTDAWASVAKAVAGDHATVSALVSGANTDPHSFEVTPAAAAQVQDATLVVYNGDGYDPFIDKLLKDGQPRVNAYQLLPADSADKNEHVFYSLSTAKKVADQVADELAKADPDDADTYRANAKTFGQQLDSISDLQHGIAEKDHGKGILATEPVASHLVSHCELVDRTPHDFAEAAEQGQDPSPADVATALDLINTKQVAALLFNSQTAGPVTNQLKQAAESHGVPVVTVTETLPDGTDYITWQRRTTEQLATALR
ncbi:manganese ABC transporter substrate-binding lipoprotein [Mycolicibacterium phlei]|uniref:metal ABC transporter solute-binding protein, Zn/Mn family n=1 Tax=Mycobacteroides chelonae TaxID=1774 RepID=UPI000618BD2F|nr:zinc ABC transporter substrate-binding protein [Mycobacteroides chelonae]AKC37698.1 ABC transporter substrate-binding protein [Mycobacteroides chelonae]OLT81114.1 ABC transporter substrate-binding protein [Mycobacteroides chelonae]ORV17146.1 ABC transporter substrate-binding protein [Mycobacteroides chelonae]VEG14686.1 manganese ABC transporter substrate-binding lipoprotein [Mycolicibacterium phlei]